MLQLQDQTECSENVVEIVTLGATNVIFLVKGQRKVLGREKY